MAFNIFGDAPQSLTGLLGEQAAQDLQKKALTTGLINAAIGYIAQPKNQRFGSALPYIGRALLAGQEGAQGVYQAAIKDFQLQQQIAEAKFAILCASLAAALLGFIFLSSVQKRSSKGTKI